MKTINRIPALFLIALAFTACTSNDIKPAKASLAYPSARPDTLLEPTRTIDGFENTGQPIKPTSDKPAKGKHQRASTDGIAPDVLSRPADVAAF